jgi:hypothetical protein
VRDTTGELSKRLHFLRTDDLILQLFARGNIHERADKAERLALTIANDRRAF